MAKRQNKRKSVKVRAKARAARRGRLPATPTAEQPVAAAGQARPVVIGPNTWTRLLMILAVCAVFYALRGLFVTFLLTIALSFIGAPVVRSLQGRGAPRALGASVFLGGLVAMLIALSMLILPTLVEELTALIKKLPAALNQLERTVSEMSGLSVPQTLSELTQQLSDNFLGQATSMIKSGGTAVSEGAMSFVSGIGRALGAAGQAIMVPVLTFFVLVELPDIRRFIVDFIPVGRRARTGEAVAAIRVALTALFRGQLIVAGCMTVLYAIGLTIAGVPLALAIAIIAGAAYLIPFASATICVLLSTAFCLLELGTAFMWPLVGAVVTAAVVQLLEGWVLTPRVVGEQAGLSPLAVILAVLIFGAWFDFLGVLFALPSATIIAVLIPFFRNGSRSSERTSAAASGGL